QSAELESKEAPSPFRGVDMELAAESSAHFRRDHPHLILWQLEHLSEIALKHVRNLCGRPDGKLLVGGEIVGYNTARLEGNRRWALMHEPLPHDLVCIFEC